MHTDTHKARKRFGQNFLHDAHVIHNIVQAIAPKTGETLVEIGPGLGALTQALLPHCDELHLIELDRDLVARLQQRYAATAQLQIHAGDALTFDVHSLKQAGRALRVVGNLPYNISTPLIFHLLQQVDVISDMLFMLQKEVVQRLAAVPNTKDYGRLSVMVQFYCTVRALFEVPPEAFNPAPKVDSALVYLRPHAQKNTEVDAQVLSRLVAQAFAQRRKTLRNNLKGLLSEQAMQAAGVDPSVRAETLSVSAFVALAKVLTELPPNPHQRPRHTGR